MDVLNLIQQPIGYIQTFRYLIDRETRLARKTGKDNRQVAETMEDAVTGNL